VSPGLPYVASGRHREVHLYGVTQPGGLPVQHSDIKLYYAGLSTAQAKSLNSAWYASLPFHSTDPAYLTVNVSYTPRDFENFKCAFECHKSQYTPEMFKALEKAMNESWQGTVSFREWDSTRSAADLFR
jgi:hypothetical protein